MRDIVREHDVAFVNDEGKVVVIDAKIGTKHFPSRTELMLIGKNGVGTIILLTDDSQKSTWYALGARHHEQGAGFRPLSAEPPRLAQFLISMIPLKHRENVPGDLEEDYRNRLIPKHGLRTARCLYWVQVVYAVADFLARPLAGIVGLGWARKVIEIIIHKLR